MSGKTVSLSRNPIPLQAMAFQQALRTALQLSNLPSALTSSSGGGGSGAARQSRTQGLICLTPKAKRSFATSRDAEAQKEQEQPAAR